MTLEREAMGRSQPTPLPEPFSVQVLYGDVRRPRLGIRISDVTAVDAEGRMGFSVRPLSAAIADRLGYGVDDGLVIARFEPYGPASRAGIRRGQLLLSINGKRVQDVEDYRRLAESIGSGDVVSVRVRDPEIGVTIINYRTR